MLLPIKKLLFAIPETEKVCNKLCADLLYPSIDICIRNNDGVSKIRALQQSRKYIDNKFDNK